MARVFLLSLVVLAVMPVCLVSGQVATASREPDMDLIAMGEPLVMRCRFTDLTASFLISFYWDKVQDSSVNIIRDRTVSDMVSDRVSTAIVENTNFIDFLLNITSVQPSDAGVYTCGFAHSDDPSIVGSSTLSMLSVSQVGSATVVVTLMAVKADGAAAYVFTDPAEVKCNFMLNGGGQSAMVKIDGVDSTNMFMMSNSSVWEGSQDGFKNRVHYVNLTKSDFMPMGTQTLECSVYDELGNTVVSDSVQVMQEVEPTTSAPLRLTCKYPAEITGGEIDQFFICTVENVAKEEITEFAWTVKDDLGEDVVITELGVTEPPHWETLEDGLVYTLRMIRVQPYMIEYNTIEARVYTSTKGTEKADITYLATAAPAGGAAGLVGSLMCTLCAAMLWLL